MAKYEALTALLSKSYPKEIQLSFAELDRLVGGLPPSARLYHAWWSNGRRSMHSHAHAWIDIGYNADVDLSRQHVSFKPQMGSTATDVSNSVDYRSIITIEPDKRSGKPCIRGMRVTVSDVLDSLGSGMTPEEIVQELPYLTLEDIKACLAFAADRERRLAARFI